MIFEIEEDIDLSGFDILNNVLFCLDLLQFDIFMFSELLVVFIEIGFESLLDEGFSLINFK